jgi:hypothetical protein
VLLLVVREQLHRKLGRFLMLALGVIIGDRMFDAERAHHLLDNSLHGGTPHSG